MARVTSLRLPAILLLISLCLGAFLTDFGEAARLQKFQHSQRFRNRHQRINKHAPAFYKHPRERFQTEAFKQEVATVSQDEGAEEDGETEGESFHGPPLHKPVILPTPRRSHSSQLPKADPGYSHQPVVLSREEFLKQFSRHARAGEEELEETFQDDDFVYDPYEDDLEEERSAEDFLNELAEQALQAEEEDEYQQQLYDQQDFYDRGNPFQVDIGQLTVVVSQMVEDSAARFEASRRATAEAMNARFDELKELLLMINARQEILEKHFDEHISAEHWSGENILGDVDESFDGAADSDGIEVDSELRHLSFASAAERSYGGAAEGDYDVGPEEEEVAEKLAEDAWEEENDWEAGNEEEEEEDDDEDEECGDHIENLREDIFILQRQVADLADLIMELLPEQEDAEDEWEEEASRPGWDDWEESDDGEEWGPVNDDRWEDSPAGPHLEDDDDGTGGAGPEEDY